MVKLTPSESKRDNLAIAQELSGQGLQVFPAKYKDKFTLVKWKAYQGIDASPMLDKWFKDRNNINFWVLTGRQSGYVVVDADSDEGDAWWREQLGDEIFDSCAVTITAKGKHYWFKIPKDWDETVAIPSWSIHPNTHDTDISFDFRADATGVIVPPSIHETGLTYKWGEIALADTPVAPPAMLDGTVRSEAPMSTGDAGSTTTGTGGATRSLLSRLLSQAPSGEGSGRNDWLARVAGHYAKMNHNQEDLYRIHCEQANRSMGQPLDEAEFNKTVESIWKGEHERNDHRAIDASCGYLASGGNTLHCQVVVNRGEDKAYEFVEYADFNLLAKGVMTDEAGARTYWAEIVRASRTDPGKTERLDIVLRAEVLGDDRAFRKFLAKFACTVVPPDNMWPKVGSPGIRVQRYLESQQPPVVRITPALGFDGDAVEPNGGFITHDGAITASGPVGLDKVTVRADPRLRASGTAPYEYGFVDNPVVARQILAEVLTFHFDDVTSVFGAYWAACLLKPQIEARTALFPFMAVEAPSESGKTNGYFAMMNQLNGNTRGETQPTKAALRDMAASHRNGMVWVDDLDDPAYLMELLRAATSGGSLTKMGEDRESVKNTHIVSPIVISGEALGLGTQKALVDRAVILKAPSPTGRKSTRNKKRPQWDDVLEVRDRYPDGLHVLAGWFVQDALGVVPEVMATLKEGRNGGSGRAADKVAVLRAGARLLDYLVRQDGAWEGRGQHALRVESWLSGTSLTDDRGVAITSDENALTYELLPWALRNWRYADKAYAADQDGDTDTPVFVRKMDTTSDQFLFGDDVEIYFRADLLAEAWDQHKRGTHEKRTATAAALKDQAMALGAKSKQIKITNGGGRRASYWMVTGVVGLTTVKRSLGQ